MGNTEFYIAIYWEDDFFTKEELVTNVLKTFALLSLVDTSLSTWYYTERPKKGLEVKPIDTSNISSVFKKSEIYNDENLLQSDLGYKIYVKSTIDFAVSNVLSITCGVKDSVVPNCVVLNIKNQQVNHFPIMIDIFQKLIELWSPERGVISNENINELIGDTFNLGAINYCKTKIEDIDQFKQKTNHLGYFYLYKGFRDLEELFS